MGGIKLENMVIEVHMGGIKLENMVAFYCWCINLLYLLFIDSLGVSDPWSNMVPV